MFSKNLVQGFIKVMFDFISKLSIITQLLGGDFERWRVFQECATEIRQGASVHLSVMAIEEISRAQGHIFVTISSSWIFRYLSKYKGIVDKYPP